MERVPASFKREKYLKDILVISFYFAFTLFLFFPTIIYYNNLFDFSFAFADILQLLVVIAIITFFISVLFFRVIPDNMMERSLVLLLLLGIILWVQGTIFIWDYGSFDGSTKIWNNFLINGVFELLIFLIIILFGIKYSQILFKHSTIILGALILTQIVIMTPFFLNPAEEPPYKGYALSNINQFAFSSDKNIVIIVMDSYQTDVFDEILYENSSLSSELDGFEYYPNSVGLYPYTTAAIPALLSGEYYLNDQSFGDYLKYKVYPNSITTTLKQEGFKTELYCDFYPYLNNPLMASNVYKQSTSIESVKPLVALTFFRISPHFLKEAIYNYQFSSLSSSNKYSPLGFYTNMTQYSYVENKSKYLKFYHLDIPHGPYTLNESLQYQELPYNREGYKEHAKASISILKGFIFKLKELNSYNNSMIIVVGDHGSGYPSDAMQYPFMKNYSIPSDIGRGIPLILIKPFNQTGNMSITEKPVSLLDIPITIMKSINNSRINYNNYSGIPLTLSQNETTRKRIYYHYSWDPAFSGKMFFPPLKEYSIEGNSWDPPSWHTTGRIYTESGSYMINNYIRNTTVTFSNLGDGKNYFVYGWSNPETTTTWTDGKKAGLEFSIQNVSTNLTFEVQASPFLVNGIVNEQVILVSVNKHHLTNWTFSGSDTKHVIIPMEYLLENEVTTISFDIPNATSPNNLGISNAETRTLGIAVEWIRLY